MGPSVMQSIEGVSQLAAAAFVSSLWQGALLAAAAALCLRMMPKMAAAVRFAIWSAVFAVIMALPFVQAWMSGAHAGISSGAGIELDVRWSYAIAAMWAIFSLARGVKLAVSALRLRSLWKRSTPVAAELMAELQGAIGGTRKVELCTSTEIDRPSVIGFFSPRILIPAWLFEKLTPAELEQIVIHEFGHISRADDWINLFQKIGLVLFPLNPALMWIDRRLCFERELACDDGVLECKHAPGAYASCLVNLAERANDRRAVSLSLGAWGRQSELAQRVHSILRRGEKMTPMQTRLASGGLVFALVGGALGLSHCPHLVSFTEAAPVADLVATMPVRVSAHALPVSYQPAVYHPSAAAHETLLKAAMPAAPAMRPANVTETRHPVPAHAVVHHTVRTPAPPRAKQASIDPQRWVVLTSWSETTGNGSAQPVVRPAMLVVNDEHAYAALPTSDGWLVIQL